MLHKFQSDDAGRFDNCIKSEDFLLLVWCILFEDIMKMM